MSNSTLIKWHVTFRLDSLTNQPPLPRGLMLSKFFNKKKHMILERAMLLREQKKTLCKEGVPCCCFKSLPVSF